MSTDTGTRGADDATLTVSDLRSNAIGYDVPVRVVFADEDGRETVMPAFTRLSHYSGVNSRFSTLTVVLTDADDREISEYRVVANGGGDDWGDLVYRPTDDRDDDQTIGTVAQVLEGHQ